ncbi:hypothetical protein [Bradyrhizobium erythrophlei]|uniref:hypothetical protein n=1 Tax=Bradyrhizobium erythrophlei TaxID=1437360 RepID=UPI0030B865A8
MNLPKATQAVDFGLRQLGKHLLLTAVGRRHFGLRSKGNRRVSMSHQQRNWRLMHQIVGHAAKQPFAQPKMAVSAHDDECRRDGSSPDAGQRQSHDDGGD